MGLQLAFVVVVPEIGSLIETTLGAQELDPRRSLAAIHRV